MKKHIIALLIIFCATGAHSQQLILNGSWRGLPVFDANTKQGKAKIAADVLTGVTEVPDNLAYKEINFDDSKWQAVDDLSQFKYAYTDGAIGFNRYFWLRKEFSVSDSLKSMLNNTGSISLVFKDIKAPDCYLNGVYIGEKYGENSSGLEYLIKTNLIKWNDKNVIAFRVRYYSPFNMKIAPYFLASSPDLLFTFENPKEDPGSCYIRNLSQKEVQGKVTVIFTQLDKKEIKQEFVDISLKPGLNKIDGQFPVSNGFINGKFKLSIPDYQLKKEWNISTGTDLIAYRPKVIPAMDKMALSFGSLTLSDQKVSGWLGERMNRNNDVRLLKVDIPQLIGGYLNQPGTHPWIGEHAGKFLDAACFSYQNHKNERLKLNMDQVAQNLIAAQKEDGYLGTYVFEKRWTSWDVWSFKYNLIGLMHYYETSGFEPALIACKRMGDLLCKTFGNKPGQIDLIKAGTHVGMASTSVMEPMVDLYRLTRDPKYIDFCNYILESYNQANGPKIIETIKETGRVDKVANGKAYEMLSNMVGILKLCKATGNKDLLKIMQTAWNDIVTNRLYITGTASSFEVFHDDHELAASADDHMGEGCVTTTWLQFNYQLLLITGELKYLDELERTVYNHLTGAENPQTGCVSYYTPLMGQKPFGCNITCCMSSIPRGIAMIPLFTNGTIGNNPCILFYQPGVSKTSTGKTVVVFNTETRFPQDGDVTITVNPAQTTKFKLDLRIPHWATDFTVLVNNTKQDIKISELTTIERVWKKGDKIDIHFSIPIKIIDGGKSYPRHLAIQRGPQVLAFDQSLNTVDAGKVTINPEKLQLKAVADILPQGWIGSQAYEIDATVDGSPTKIILVPYADASQSGGVITTWLKNI